MDRRQIARLYLRTWFLADIISIIPVRPQPHTLLTALSRLS